MKRILAADLFCGAGGTSTGLSQACARLGLDVDLLAINHWDVAIATHTANHPDARHLCESLDNVDPRKVVPGGRLNLLCASPECTHHSVARGGKPINDQSRASAWHILRWAEALYIDHILIENVREFQTWGPIGANGRPLPSKKGQTFQAFITALRSLGYSVEWRVLNAADYGDPTTRERLFIMARRGNKPITWPEPRYAQAGGSQSELFGDKSPWRSAREIIDWSSHGQSIFSRKKPLAPATMARIAAGLRKFGGKKAEPFLVVLRRNQGARDLDKPLPTATCSGANFGLCEPFIMPLNRPRDRMRGVEEPLQTVTATSADFGLVEPFLVGCGGPSGSGKPRSVNDPMGTVLTENHIGLVEPFIVSMEHGGGSKSIDPFVIPTNHGGRDFRSHEIDRPMPTITTVDAWALIEPFLVEYYGTGNASGLDHPIPTVTTKDRFGLVEVDGMRLDIRFRMLQPHELARAQGFPDDYQFTGSREAKVKQIGNAVPCHVATELCGEILSEYAQRRERVA